MGDLISRQDVLEALRTCYETERIDYTNGNEYINYEQAVHEIEQLPAAQPEITYCKDCKHWEKTCGDNQWSLGNCGLFEKRLVMCKGYCAWAERRTDGSD